MKAARASWLRALEMSAPVRRGITPPFPLVIAEQAERFGDRTALLAENVSWSYRKLAQEANRYTRWAESEGVKAGEVTCLLMPNRPEFLAIWLGLTRIGGVVALVNTNLVGEGLARAIGMVGPSRIVVDASLAATLKTIETTLPGRSRCWIHGQSEENWPRIDRDAADASGDPIHSAVPALADPALYIYTSGTSGFPKAAKISHRRIAEWSYWFAGMMGMAAEDRMYNCLPMYHAIGGIVGIGAPLVAGGSVALRQRFSARQFWRDVTEWDCTLFQYIGELCRYLVNSPVQPEETRHRIRLCCGSGLGPDIWARFEERFRIPRILEFYAATEGAMSLYNCEGKRGAVGRVPWFLAHRSTVALVKLDPETGEPVRDAGGRYCEPACNEPGEALGRLAADGAGGSGRFEGYSDLAASEAKLIRDVFDAGDAWFRTGDLMRKDTQGFFHFVDRLGDTFRWKGETVSTTEVAAALAGCAGIGDAVVYGVRVPGTDGRAGMAAIVAGPGFDLAMLARELGARLPDYARPVFLRFCDAIETTATFRPQKQELARQGFDPEAIADPVYFYDGSRTAFVRLDPALHQQIVRGELRL